MLALHSGGNELLAGNQDQVPTFLERATNLLVLAV